MPKERRLEGAIVVLTRRPEDNRALAWELREAGADVIELPCVRIEPVADTRELAAAVGRLDPADLLVLTSRAAVEAVGDVRPSGGVACAVAAVGDATAEAASSLGMRVRFVASHADSRTLGRELPLPRGRVVLARSDLADGDLPALLRRRGASVLEVVAYRAVAEATGDVAAVRRALDRGPLTVVCASPSAVDALVAALGAPALRRATVTFVAIGPRTAARVRERTGAKAIVAASTDARALAAAVPSPYGEEVAS